MKQLSFLSLIFVFLIGCGSDATSHKNIDADANTEQASEVLENILPSYEEVNTDESGKVTSDKEVKQTVDNKTKYEIKPAEKNEESSRLAMEKVAKSDNSGKTCDELISQFDLLVNKLVSSPNEASITAFSKFIADPFHLNCKKIDEKYKNEIAKIEERLEDEDEDEY